MRLPAGYRHRRVEPAKTRSYAAGLGPRSARVVRWGGLILVFAQTFARGALTVLLVILVLDELALGDDVVGLAGRPRGRRPDRVPCTGCGPPRLHLGHSFVLGVALWGAGLVALSISATPWLAALAMVVIGIGNALEGREPVHLGGPPRAARVVAQALGAIEIVAVREWRPAPPSPRGGRDGRRGDRSARPRRRRHCARDALPPRSVRWTELPFSRRATTDLLTDVSIFEPLPVVIVEHLASLLERHEYGPGDVVMREGDDGDTVHIIGSGTARVTVPGAARPHLGPGDTFGEIALLRHSPRTATVTAQASLTTYRLDREGLPHGHSGQPRRHEALADVRLARDASS